MLYSIAHTLHGLGGRTRSRLVGTVGEPRIGSLAKVNRAVGGPLLRVGFNVHVTGRRNLPVDGPAIISANHRSFFDTPVLMVTATRPVIFLGKAEYMDSAWTRYLFPAIGMVPIQRSDRRASAAALETAAQLLNEGHFVGIYPEGTRTRDGLLHRGKSGVAQLSLMTGAPIIPVGITGTERTQPIGARFPRPFGGRIRVRYGEPIEPDNYRYGGGRKRRQHIVADVMQSIASMTDQTVAPDFSTHDNPLMGGGTEAVYRITHHGAEGLGWRHAVERAVDAGGRRFDDGRVAEVEKLSCYIADDGRFHFGAQISMSSKFTGGTHHE